MIVNDERSQISSEWKEYRIYEPDILLRLQLLLATLADLDIAHASNMLVIESRNLGDTRKDQLIADLWQTHYKLRAPYIREIETLREGMEAAFR